MTQMYVHTHKSLINVYNLYPLATMQQWPALM